MRLSSKISPAIFLLSVLCFFFPFVTVSCGGHKIASATGVQLATGTTLELPQAFGPSREQKVGQEPLSAVAALCAVIGLGVSFAGARAAIVPAISGVVGALSLLTMKSRIDDGIVKHGQGMLQANYEIGFFLALLLMIAGAVWNGYLFSQSAKATAASPSGWPPPPRISGDSN
jgi:hypothetical protein